MTNAIISILVQLGIVLLVAAGAWLVSGRRVSFREVIGLLPAPLKVVLITGAAGAALAFLVTSIPAVREFGAARGTVPGETALAGFSGEVAVILALKAILQTSLTEELLFRGLIGRNLIRRWGFATGNGVQAAAFGLTHLLLLLVPRVTIVAVLAFVLLTGLAGWVLGWVNHRWANGSILPGWAAHGAGNLAAYYWLAFAG